jgi:Protein of unknown function (DUF2934)
MTDKPAKPARRRIRTAKPRTKPTATSARPEPTHSEISERAYFIALEHGGGDELSHWLRAERELAAA